jgi:type II secretory pathway pseudopilin PulG
MTRCSTSPARPRRSGITLTEILISILILGVGMISLATLFPLGLLRYRDAQRNTRAAYLYQSAVSEVKTRNLLNPDTFIKQGLSPWYWSNNGVYFPTVANFPLNYDPWVQDTASYGANPFSPNPGATTNPLLTGTTTRQGLPVAYDPLWRFVTQNPNLALGGGYYPGAASEARFASGIGYVRNDPNPGGVSNLASAHGLQRITNFNPLLGTVVAVPEIFVSPEDLVLQATNAPSTDIKNNTITTPSGTVPILNTLNNTYSTAVDWRYTWMFTGFKTDIIESIYYEGTIVVFENRPFAIDHVNTPLAGLQWVVAGEPVVEAVWGFGSLGANKALGYGQASDRVVLLRWPNSMPDPDIRVGGWIADVTYERNQAESAFRFPGGNATTPIYPAQRCHWYQIVKKSSADDESNSAGLQQPGFRCITVWTGSPLKAKTLLQNGNPPQPVHVNAALVSPYVVQAIPASFTMHSNISQ